MTTVNPRTLGYACLVLGVVLVIVGLSDLMSLGQPIRFSSPSPAFDAWLIKTFGHKGVRLILAVGWLLFGVLFLRRWWRVMGQADAE
jgi:hypothetical protein